MISEISLVGHDTASALHARMLIEDHEASRARPSRLIGASSDTIGEHAVKHAAPVYYYRQIHQLPLADKHVAGKTANVEVDAVVFASQKRILNKLLAQEAEDIIAESAYDKPRTYLLSDDQRARNDLKRNQGYLDTQDTFDLIDFGAAYVYPRFTNNAFTIHPSVTQPTYEKAVEAVQRKFALYDECEALSHKHADLLQRAEEIANRSSYDLTLSDMETARNHLRTIKNETSAYAVKMKKVNTSYRAIFDTRDEEMIQSILQFREKNPDKPVHVIMGAAHQIPEKLAARHPEIPLIEPLEESPSV